MYIIRLVVLTVAQTPWSRSTLCSRCKSKEPTLKCTCEVDDVPQHVPRGDIQGTLRLEGVETSVHLVPLAQSLWRPSPVAPNLAFGYLPSARPFNDLIFMLPFWNRCLMECPTHSPAITRYRILLRATFSHVRLRAVTMKLWEPKRKCPKAVPSHPPKSCSVVTDPRV